MDEKTKDSVEKDVKASVDAKTQNNHHHHHHVHWDNPIEFLMYFT